jgi:hypothetical protein
MPKLLTSIVFRRACFVHLRLTIILFVLPRLMVCDYAFGIFIYKSLDGLNVT